MTPHPMAAQSQFLSSCPRFAVPHARIETVGELISWTIFASDMDGEGELVSEMLVINWKSGATVWVSSRNVGFHPSRTYLLSCAEVQRKEHRQAPAVRSVTRLGH